MKMKMTMPKPPRFYFIWTQANGAEYLCDFKDYVVVPPETVEAARRVIDTWQRSSQFEKYRFLEEDSWTPPLVSISIIYDI